MPGGYARIPVLRDTCVRGTRVYEEVVEPGSDVWILLSVQRTETQVVQCLVEVLLFGGVRHEGLECGSAIEVGCTVSAPCSLWRIGPGTVPVHAQYCPRLMNHYINAMHAASLRLVYSFDHSSRLPQPPPHWLRYEVWSTVGLHAAGANVMQLNISVIFDVIRRSFL
ncbi:hypothetical protein SCLCIDRAFT_746172 [Scleroderma citrinum Foug A]|uniref:Uncharacterized protein n=1 Tax=Scleroderma citrinum Foug A TaxID=1036808 RepID=A0A0C3E657_9AGAM|nr:hypothetical protein SCLCIDRAFT_746172 [Scleroderma citrinum Foug A]